MKLRKLFLPLILIISVLFTGCAEFIEELESMDEDEGNGVIVEEELVEDEDETTAEETTDETVDAAEATTTTEETDVVLDPNVDDAMLVTPVTEEDIEEVTIDFDGAYTTAEDVALYIYTYGQLPSNFITKNEARALGWEGGSVERYAPGMCIGGDHYGNYEGVLPAGNYTECDINTLGANSRGAERLVFSDDGRIYYTCDHYETFTILYGAE